MKNIDFSSTCMDSCNIFIVCLLSSELITLTKIHLENMSLKTMFLMFDWRESNANVHFSARFSVAYLLGDYQEDLYERNDRDGHVGSRKVETVQTDNESTGRALFGDRRMHEDSRPHHSSTQPDASTLKYKRALGFAGLASLSHARFCWYDPFVLETRFFLIGQIFQMFVKSISTENWTINGLMNYVTYLI